jgi:hypothetical protein
MAVHIPVACHTCGLTTTVASGLTGPDKQARCTRCQTLIVDRSGVRVACAGCGRYVLVRRHWYGLDGNAQCPMCHTHLVGIKAIRDVLGPDALRLPPAPVVAPIRRVKQPMWESDPIGWAADAGLLDDDADND